jgi:Tfp pilus assembly protein PilF
MSLIDNLEALLARGQDSAMLRFGLGNAYLSAGDADTAALHLGQAVAQDPGYSAAWKLYGNALGQLGRQEESAQAYRQGIAAAEKRGDVQSAKEMKVFLRRLERADEG